MAWDATLVATSTWAKPEHLETVRRNLDASWIEAALASTGTATVRRRRLPVEEVVWVVLGMALFRDRPMEDIVSKLDLALPGNGGTVARSSVVQARQRLGSGLLDREEAIRSKTREGVEQELWGVLLAYNLVRVERRTRRTK